MDEKPKITFADSFVPTGKVGWIAGLPLTVSPGASDILAAFQLAFTLMQQLTGIESSGAPQQMVMSGEPEEDDEPPGLDMRYANSLSPLARAEYLAMYGLEQAGIEPKEPDPTAEQVKRILAEEMAKYKPSDEGEGE